METDHFENFVLLVPIQGNETEVSVDEKNINGELIYTANVAGKGSNDLYMDMDSGNLKFRQQYPFWQALEEPLAKMIEARNR